MKQNISTASLLVVVVLFITTLLSCAPEQSPLTLEDLEGILILTFDDGEHLSSVVWQQQESDIYALSAAEQ